MEENVVCIHNRNYFSHKEQSLLFAGKGTEVEILPELNYPQKVSYVWVLDFTDTQDPRRADHMKAEEKQFEEQDN